MRRASTTNLVAQKIRLLNALAKSVKEIFNMLQKDLIYLGLNKKNSKKLRAAFDGYIKAISFTIYFHHFLNYKLLNLVNRVKQTKLN